MCWPSFAQLRLVVYVHAVERSLRTGIVESKFKLRIRLISLSLVNVDLERFELSTSRLQSARSSQLSYRPN